ncbi:helix-turn-helix transcriptional regulator [Actinokineospora sp. NBRC 105648]|uniref:helix-turn-helix domain-containing protein n=1 Tax=Actinokineospora sp. NBRC 105648 TaxID=3032206 RepID=UPI0024A464FB|nr:helix-turn-helix transcriptional regulator [Actinokineospora sp. NBRC 105648]GLZ43051.1 hypothetical protein Acsp05_66750 [Actinokineospora sp. NBRC 105648]
MSTRLGGWVLGIELRRVHRAAGFSQRGLAQELGWDASKLSRLLSGLRVVTEAELLLVLWVCGVKTARERERFRSLAARADQHRWWPGFEDSSLSFRVSGVLEDQARAILCYSPNVVPALLRTARYGQALPVAEGATPGLFNRFRPPQCVFLVGERALTHPGPMPSIMRGQARHLAALAQRVAIRVVPEALAFGWEGPFRILDVPDLGRTVQVDQPRSTLFLHDKESVDAYAALARELMGIALSEERSRGLLREIAGDALVRQ